MGHLSQAQSFLFLTRNLFLFVVYWCCREECCYKAWTVLAEMDFFRNVGNGFVYFPACLSSVKSGFFSRREGLGGAHMPCLAALKCQQLTAIALSWRGHHSPARGHQTGVAASQGTWDKWKWRPQGEGRALESHWGAVSWCQPYKRCLGHGFSARARTHSRQRHRAPGSPQGLGSSWDVFSNGIWQGLDKMWGQRAPCAILAAVWFLLGNS